MTVQPERAKKDYSCYSCYLDDLWFTEITPKALTFWTLTTLTSFTVSDIAGNQAGLYTSKVKGAAKSWLRYIFALESPSQAPGVEHVIVSCNPYSTSRCYLSANAAVSDPRQCAIDCSAHLPSSRHINHHNQPDCSLARLLCPVLC